VTEPKRTRRYSPEGRRVAWELVVDVCYIWCCWVRPGESADTMPDGYHLATTARAVARVLEREHIAEDGTLLWDPHPPKETP